MYIIATFAAAFILVQLCNVKGVTGLMAESDGGGTAQASLPDGFVYLSDIDPTIVQAVRYSGPENALGRPLDGYKHNTIILTSAIAEKLKRIQRKLVVGAGESNNTFGLSLAVYDAYRPRKAVDDFWQWAHLPPSNASGYDPDAMGPKYFPKFCCDTAINGQTRATLFEKGYISKRSNHARGSTIDITIVADTPEAKSAVRRGSEQLIALRHREFNVVDPPAAVADSSAIPPRLLIPTSSPPTFGFDRKIREYIWPRLSAQQRAFIDSLNNTNKHTSTARVSFPFLDDGSVDMGTSFDLFDVASHPLWPGHFYVPNKQKNTNMEPRVSSEPSAIIASPTFLIRRLFLQCIFEEEGFEIADEEWWHFWLAKGEPFPFRPDEPEWGFNFDV